MKCIDRYEEYRDDELDRIMLFIKNGVIKTGRYAHLVKIDETKIIKGKRLFSDEKDDNTSE